MSAPASQQPTAAASPALSRKKYWQHLVDYKFLAAAAAGGVLGLAGINAAAAPLLAAFPGLFFQGLPYLAVPFIGLNIFKAFSSKGLMQEAGTFARFGAIMLVGFGISMGMTAALSGLLPSAAVLTGGTAAVSAGAAGFTQYILHSIVGCAAFAALYKAAKHRLSPEPQTAPEKKPGLKGTLSQAWNKAAAGILNKYTAPPIIAAGKIAHHAAHGMDYIFQKYMTWVGTPAVFAVMSKTVATTGLAGLAAFGGYYAVVASAFAAAAVTLTTATALYQIRKKNPATEQQKKASRRARRHKLKKAFQGTAKVTATALGTSSSLATMPVTKQGLKEMGVSEKTRNSVVPLGANFNMMGTSLYLGTTAGCANIIFGNEMSLTQHFNIMATSVTMAFGAPGMPASNITLLAPVMAQTGLPPSSIEKMYAMVIPGDRLLDMGQTALNVWGDMVVALGKDHRQKKARAKNIAAIRQKRLAAQNGMAPA